jgi:putative membrane protein
MLKGMVMGIANVIPGVSGGTMAVSMGIYDKLIGSITHLFKDLKKSIITLLPIGLGMVIGILALARVIEFMFERIPVQTNTFFIGLIAGGLPMIIKEVKGQKIKLSGIVGFLVFFVLVIGMAALDGASGNNAEFSKGITDIIKLFGAGIVAAATMVIPGVSGSMMLMLLGYYEPVISAVNEAVDGLRGVEGASFASALFVLIPFGIGVVVGIFAIAKLIEWLFSKFKLTVYWAIIGLISASPIAIIMMNSESFKNINALTVITAIISLAAGAVIAFFLGGDPEKKEKKEEN